MDQIKLEAEIRDFHSDLWRHYLVIPEDIAAQFIEGADRRIICTFPDGDQLHTALMPDRGKWFVLLKMPLVKKYRVGEGDKLQVVLEKDKTEFGMPMPEEMDAVLSQDEEALKVFLNLTPGKRRSLIYIVSQVKNPDSRIRKSLAIAEHLNEAGTQIDFKRLNELIKGKK